MMSTREDRRAFGLSEFSKMFGVSLDQVKRLATAGVLKTIMLGGRRLVPLSETLRVEQFGLPMPNGRQRKQPAEAR